MANRYQRPGKQKSYDGDQRAIVAEDEAIRRNETKKNPPKPLVKLEPEPAESWPPGTAWLDTSVE